eukprot:5311557-Prorocentrum_lima.AAC.1
MTSSLVGSEMCIRDRPRKRRMVWTNFDQESTSPKDLGSWWTGSTWIRTVSYTHLTLPTICSV